MTPSAVLYAPADRLDRVDKALRLGTGVAIADLEDAIPSAGKDAALDALLAFVRDGEIPEASELWVRVNPGERGLHEIDRLAEYGITGFCLAKAESVDDIQAVDRLLTSREAERKLPPGSRRLEALVESSLAVRNLDAIVRASGRLTRLQLGESDLCADLGIDREAPSHVLWAVRAAAVTASAAARLDKPLGPVSGNFRDLEVLTIESRQLKQNGFGGRACIHPDQVSPVMQAFAPTAEEIAQAEAIVARLAESGGGVALDGFGNVIDEAVGRRARQVAPSAEGNPGADPP